MLVIYIAGPFRAPSFWGIVQHIRRAEAVALSVWQAGMVALCPHLNTANFDGAADDARWLAGDLELLRRSDAVLLVEGWPSSTGAKAEVEEARAHGIPVFETLSMLEAWRQHVRPRQIDRRRSAESV